MISFVLEKEREKAEAGGIYQGFVNTLNKIVKYKTTRTLQKRSKEKREQHRTKWLKTGFKRMRKRYRVTAGVRNFVENVPEDMGETEENQDVKEDGVEAW